VRFLFAPLEEITYNYYTRGSEEESKKTLLGLLRVITVLSCLSVGFGFRYSENVLFILYGEKWVSADSVLAFQCYMALLAVLGINGTMEAFVMARADVVKTIPKFKYFTLLSTAFYVSTSLLLLHLGFGYLC
jgi:O-antigen/teichoic acid export membrane protein